MNWKEKRKGLFSSINMDWETPQEFFDELDQEFNFKLDPCASNDNAKCKHYFTAEIDGLSQDWFGPVFMNPPYGRDIKKWIKKAYEESQRGITVVCLIPARTDTAWWHDYCMKGEIRFIRGRLYFSRNGKTGRAPFPSAIVIFNKKVEQSVLL